MSCETCLVCQEHVFASRLVSAHVPGYGWLHVGCAAMVLDLADGLDVEEEFPGDDPGQMFLFPVEGVVSGVVVGSAGSPSARRAAGC